MSKSLDSMSTDCSTCRVACRGEPLLQMLQNDESLRATDQSNQLESHMANGRQWSSNLPSRLQKSAALVFFQHWVTDMREGEFTKQKRVRMS